MTCESFSTLLIRLSSSLGSRYNDWPNHVPMTEAEIDTALANIDTWISDDDTGPIMLMTTDHADRLLGR